MPLSCFATEILLSITKNLDISSLYSLIRVNRYFATLLTEELYRLIAQGPTAIESLIVMIVIRNRQAVQVFLERGPAMFIKADAKTVLHQVPGKCDDAVISQVLEAGTNVTIRKRLGRRKCWEGPALCWVARIGNQPLMSFLLARGANIDAVDIMSHTALHNAVAQGHELDVRELLANRANTSVRSKFGATPLDLSRKYKHFSISELLIMGGDVDFRHNNDSTLLQHAITLPNTIMVRFLLGKGADVNARDSEGDTALHLAVLANNHAAVLALLNYGAIIYNNRRGRSPIYAAQMIGDIVMAKYLLRKVDSTFLEECLSWTVAHYAVYYGEEKLVRVLVKSDLDLNKKDTRGRTPLMLACEWGNAKIIQLLRNAQNRTQTPR